MRVSRAGENASRTPSRAASQSATRACRSASGAVHHGSSSRSHSATTERPALAAATRNTVALVWKIVLVVELLGRSDGVGFQIHTYFQFFDVRAILGYALAFVAIMLAVEIAVLQPLERRATRWRRRDG